MTEKVDPVQVYVQGFLATFGNDCGKRLHEIATTIGLSVTEVDAENFDGALLRLSDVNRTIERTCEYDRERRRLCVARLHISCVVFRVANRVAALMGSIPCGGWAHSCVANCSGDLIGSTHFPRPAECLVVRW